VSWNRCSGRQARSQIDDIVAARKAVKGVPVVARKVEVVDAAVLRELAEQASAKMSSGVVVLALASGGRLRLWRCVPGPAR
jgi:alanyl-tRNA synthetase